MNVQRSRAHAVISFLKEFWSDFQRHNDQWLAAAIAYFALFAIAPLMIVVVEIAGFFLGQHRAVLDDLYRYLAHSAGTSAASAVRSIVTSTFAERRSGTIAQAVGWGLFVFAVVGLFGALQQALNTVWDVTPSKQPLRALIRNRLVSFGVVLLIAVLLLLALGTNSALTVAGDALAHISPFFPALMKAADFVATFAVVTVLFALLFEYLPECQIRWRDVWIGAAVSSLLFDIGQFILGWYLGRSAISSGYGIFGGVVALLLWANYTALIVLAGAEFTHLYARRRASRLGSTGTYSGSASTTSSPAAYRVVPTTTGELHVKGEPQ